MRLLGLILAALAAGVVVPAAAAAAPAGIVAAYGFDERSGPVLRDASARGAHARGHGVRRVDGGRFGRALRFDGRTSLVVVPGVRALRLRAGMTLQAWVRPTRTTGWRPVIVKDGGSAPAWALYAATPRGGPVAAATLAGRLVRSRPTVPRLRAGWVNLATTYDGSRLRVYRDGRLVSAPRARGALRVSSGRLRIGGDRARGPRFAGLIDEVRIYRRALSPREIRAEMTRPVSGSGPPAAPVPADPAPAPGSPPRGPVDMHFGVVATRDTTTITNIRARAGAGLTRIGFPIGTPVTAMRTYVARAAENRIRPVLLAEFPYRIATPEEARGLAEWAREFGPGGTFWEGRTDGAYAPRYIEFGNETGYTYQGMTDRGGEYALRVRDAHGAIQAANPRVGLLVQADDTSISTAVWVNGMFDAVPDLASMVAMWTVHPYGPRSRWEPRLRALISQTAARGAPSSIPIAITEWGLATDDGRPLSGNYEWPVDMTYAQAAAALTSTLAEIDARFPDRIALFLYYYSFDHAAPGESSDREDYFGAFRKDFSDKGPLSDAIRAAAARYPGGG